MIRRPPRSTQSRSSAASDVYKRQLMVLAFQRRQGGANRLKCSAPRRVDFVQMESEQLQTGSVVQNHFQAGLLVGGGSELQNDAQMIGQLVVGEYQSGLGVDLLDAK